MRRASRAPRARSAGQRFAAVCLGLLCLAAVLTWPLSLRAQPTPVEAPPRAGERRDDSYEELLRTAIAAQAAGDFETSYVLFSRAHALQPNARTLRAMGVAAFQRGDDVQAIGHLEAALVHTEKPLDRELRVAVEELLGRARAKVGVFRVVVEPAQAELRVDDEPLARELSRPLYLRPGEHTLLISAAGYQARKVSVQVHAGANEGLRVALAAEPAQPVGTAARPIEQASPGVEPAREREPARAPPSPARRRARWALVGVAAASGAAGLGLWYAANGRVDAIARACAASEAEGCTRAERAAELERANLRALEIGCDAAIAVAGTALVGAAGLWLWDRSPFFAPSVELSNRALGLRWSGRF